MLFLLLYVYFCYMHVYRLLYKYHINAILHNIIDATLIPYRWHIDAMLMPYSGTLMTYHMVGNFHR